MSHLVFDPIRGEYINPETGEVVEDHVAYEGEYGYISIKLGTGEEREKRKQYRRLKAYVFNYGLGSQNLKLLSREERSLKHLITLTRQYGERLHLPTYVIEEAVRQVEKVFKKNKYYIVNDSLKKILVILLLSARAYGIPLSINDIKQLLGKKKIRRLSKLIRELKAKGVTLDLKPRNKADVIFSTIKKLAREYNVDDETALAMIRLAQKISKTELFEMKKPETVAVAVFYLVAKTLGHSITQKELADKYGLTTGILRLTYLRLFNNFKIEVEVGD